MELNEIGGAVTSYLTAAVALSIDQGPVIVLGFSLLIIRLIYEFLRLIKFVIKWRGDYRG